MLRITLSLLILLTATTAALPARDSTTLRRALERNYGDWQRAILHHDLDGWSRAIAPSRRVMTRNLIISQRQPWPAALFSLPFRPPSLSSLRFLKAEANPADTAAVAVYFGPVDLGLASPPDGIIPENLFLLHYIKETKTGPWRFDRTQLLHLGPDITPDGQPGLRSRIARGDEREFLKGPAFRPYQDPPPTPPTVEQIPAYVAHLDVSSPGYRTRIRINGGLHDSETIDENTRDIIIGGLKEGKNEIEITMQPLETTGPDRTQTSKTSSTPLELPVGKSTASAVDPSLINSGSGLTLPSPTAPNTPDSATAQAPPAFKIEVQILREAENLPPATIFTYAPKNPPATHKSPIWANAVTIK